MQQHVQLVQLRSCLLCKTNVITVALQRASWQQAASPCFPPPAEYNLTKGVDQPHEGAQVVLDCQAGEVSNYL